MFGPHTTDFVIQIDLNFVSANNVSKNNLFLRRGLYRDMDYYRLMKYLLACPNLNDSKLSK